MNHDPLFNRRDLLRRAGMGLGMLGLAGLLADEARADATDLHPLAPKQPHFRPRAKQVVHLFMNGGPSHVDTFDPKPLLDKYHGKPLPNPNLRTERKTAGAFRSPFTFRKYGQSGIEVSDLFAHTAEHVDDLCVIRSMCADVPNHEPSLMLMNCGDGRLPRPSVGSWVTYGLGSENQNLPGFIAMCPGGYPIVGTQNWRSAFLPGAYQGTYLDTRHTDVNLAAQHRSLAQGWDQPTAAFLDDLKQRGLFDSTLVLWGGEFGRTPVAELPGLSGRDHNHYGFTMWLAGGGVKGGRVHGATDEFGFAAVENRVHVHDLHATMLHLLGLDHTRLTYRYAGRDFRLTDVHGEVVTDLLA